MTTPPNVRRPDPDGVVTLRSLDDAVLAATGHEAVPEVTWRAAATAPDDCLLATAADGRVAAMTLPSDSFTPAFRQLVVAAEPATAPEEVAAVLGPLVTAEEAATLTAWLPGTIASIETALTGLGFALDRRQHQMRTPLPLPHEIRIPDGVRLAAFRPGTDDAAWLRVNNRAFENHPDQGGWVESVLRRRMAEPWFSPAGFLLAWRGDELAGFCWTKVHEAPERLGEIFVIGVDPDAQGLGLGKALVLAGLDHLARERDCPAGVLYVAAGNTAAVGLYESIGFHVTRTDSAFVRRAP